MVLSLNILVNFLTPNKPLSPQQSTKSNPQNLSVKKELTHNKYKNPED